jgi:hypothetical protein
LSLEYDAVESFFGRFGQEFLSHRDMFFGGEAKAVDKGFDLEFSFLDALENLDFLLAGQQGHSGHLMHVLADWVVQGLKLPILLGLVFIGFVC